MSAEDARTIHVLSTPHCARCDSEGRPLIEFRRPNNLAHYLCALCVEQEDKRELRFTTGWKRSRRPSRQPKEKVPVKSFGAAHL